MVNDKFTSFHTLLYFQSNIVPFGNGMESENMGMDNSFNGSQTALRLDISKTPVGSL